ncbi:hypothetical protein ACIBG8_29010 [Nonomuraea sp. NPDC050556]|uniref:hypothetical protein n=1 Tax=Nonomuraea sp. NPDC050556 TaxID=3364369 RepID=UPI0037B8ECCD
MTLETALDQLRDHLEASGMHTDDRDVFWAASKDPVLSLAPGLVVWITLQYGFRWPGKAARWCSHPLDDPAEAARLIMSDLPSSTRTTGEPTDGLPV